MKWMRFFFHSIWGAISSVHFYKFALQWPLKKVLGIYFLFLFFVALSMSARYWLQIIPLWQNFLDQSQTELVNNYPNELTFNWTGEVLQSSSTDPITVPFPSTTHQRFTELSQNLATYYPTQTEPENFTDSFFVITPTTNYVSMGSDNRQEQSLTEILGTERFETNKASIAKQSESIKNYLVEAAQLVGFVTPVVFYLYLIVSRFYFMLIELLLVFLLLRIQGNPLPLSKIFQLGLLIFIPAEIVQQIANWLMVTSPFSLVSLVFWVFFITIFFSFKKMDWAAILIAASPDRSRSNNPSKDK